jgi:hypothetical protein
MSLVFVTSRESPPIADIGLDIFDFNLRRTQLDGERRLNLALALKLKRRVRMSDNRNVIIHRSVAFVIVLTTTRRVRFGRRDRRYPGFCLTLERLFSVLVGFPQTRRIEFLAAGLRRMRWTACRVHCFKPTESYWDADTFLVSFIVNWGVSLQQDEQIRSGLISSNPSRWIGHPTTCRDCRVDLTLPAYLTVRNVGSRFTETVRSQCLWCQFNSRTCSLTCSIGV